MKKQKEKINNHISDDKNKNILISVLIAISIIIFGFLFRFINFNSVITDNIVELKGADAYFFVRQASLIQEMGYLPNRDMNLCFSEGYEYQKESSLYPYLLSFLSDSNSLETITAYLSPLLALFVSVVMYLILIEIFNKKYKPIYIGLSIVSLTGIQYIARSYFGFGDRHVLEVFLLALGLLFLIKSINRNSIIYIVLSALVFNLYQLTWSQTSLIVLLILVSLSIAYIKEKNISGKYALIGVLFFILQLPSGIIANYSQSIGISLIGVFVTISLFLINKYFKTLKSRTVILISIFTITSLLSIIFFQDFVNRLLYIIMGFLAEKTEGPIVSEAQPMLNIYSNISLIPPNVVFFQLSLFFLSIFGLYKMFKSKYYYLSIFGILLALLSLHRIRTEYYFIILSSISLAYLVYKNPNVFKYILILIIGFLLTYISNWVNDIQNEKTSLAFTPSDYSMAEWINNNISDEMISNYGFLADWQLGYLYTYISNKPFLAEPNFCNYLKPTEFFMMKSEEEAYNYVKSLGIKYIVIKDINYSKYYYHLSQLKKENEFKLLRAEYNGEERIFYDQGYFQRMFSRLYNFDGKAYTPNEVYIVENNVIKKYSSLEEAKEISLSGFYSLNRFNSSVPLDELRYFKLIHEESDSFGGVKLFEVLL